MLDIRDNKLIIKMWEDEQVKPFIETTIKEKHLSKGNNIIYTDLGFKFLCSEDINCYVFIDFEVEDDQLIITIYGQYAWDIIEIFSAIQKALVEED